jgi:hypothetical protein
MSSRRAVSWRRSLDVMVMWMKHATQVCVNLISQNHASIDDSWTDAGNRTLNNSIAFQVLR